MKWTKLGVVWQPDGDQWWSKSHATCPTPILIRENEIRVYIQCRDASGIGRVGYVDLDANDPRKVLRSSDAPVLDIGVPGAFDDNGVLQTSIVRVGKLLYLYYVGFELCYHIRYRLLTGLAISHDGGESFQRFKQTPILERSDKELYFRCGPFVRLEDNRFRMWYIGGNQWITLNNKPLPVYDLRYIESTNGIDWPDTGQIVMRIDNPDEHGFGRPYVTKEASLYRMFYSIRKVSFGQYRVGYAESADGLLWQRKDQQLGLDVSSSGWDDQSVEYTAVFNSGGKTWMLYNGNDFGATGFGVARLDQSE